MSLRKLQRRLKVLGLYSGTVNGEASKALQDAIRRYREGDIRDEEVDRLMEERW